MIELIDVQKRYGAFTAVRDLNFAVKSGEIIGLVGPNGAGKTTTMKMITGFLAPTDGQVIVEGTEVLRNPRRAQERIGYLPEHNPLYPEMSVLGYLLFMGRMRGLRGAKLNERRQIVIAACSLEEVAGKPIRQLSKGFRQRVGIAAAMIHDPSILILDEPTSGLDPNQIVDIRDLIRDLGRDKTVILSTHILSEVEETCTRALMIVAGRLAVDDSIANLRGGHRLRLAVAGASPQLADRIATLPGVASATIVNGSQPDCTAVSIAPNEGHDLASALFEFAKSEGLALIELAREKQSIEDVFREASRSFEGMPR